MEHHKLYENPDWVTRKSRETGGIRNRTTVSGTEAEVPGNRACSPAKKITPVEQWCAVFEILLADAKNPTGRMQLYYLDGMYSELFTELSRYQYIGTFQSYEEALRHWDPEQTLKLYTEILRVEMDRACDRKQYRHVASYLSRLRVYPGGIEEARALSAYWHVYHKNRPAMKDELKKAEYSQEERNGQSHIAARLPI